MTAYFVRVNIPTGFRTLGPLADILTIASVVAGCLWALLYLGMHGYAFPVSLRGAFITTVLPLVNLAATGFALRAILQTSFVFVFVPLVAHILGLAIIWILLIVPRFRPLIPAEVEGWMKYLIGGIILLLLVMGGILWISFVGSIRPATTIQLAFAFTGSLVHLISESRLMYNCSVFASQSEEKMETHNNWAGLTAVCLILTLLGAGGVLLWN